MKPHIAAMLMIACLFSGAAIALSYSSMLITQDTIEINRLHQLRENDKIDCQLKIKAYQRMLAQPENKM
jgi:hypothetical protein